MLRKTRILFLLTVLALIMSAPAAAFEVRVSLFTRSIEGTGGNPAFRVSVELFDKNDRLKGNFRTMPFAPDGRWGVYFTSGAVVAPGDTVRVTHMGIIREHKPAAVKITRIRTGSDIVAGRIIPRKSPVQIHVKADRMVWGGSTRHEYDRSGPTDGDGRFQIDMTPVMNLKRSDTVHAGYQEGDFIVYQGMYVPGIRIFTGDNQVLFRGAPGKSYTATLLSGSSVKGVSSLTTLDHGLYMMSTNFSFFKRSGAPVRIKRGNRLRIDGKWGFTTLIKPLRAAAYPGTPSYLTVSTFPGALVHIRLTRFASNGDYVDDLEAWRYADPTGHISHTWPGQIFHTGDTLRLQTQDGKGDNYHYTSQVLP